MPTLRKLLILRKIKTLPLLRAAPTHEKSEKESADSKLSQVIEAWPELPGPIKAGIMAMVKFASPN